MVRILGSSGSSSGSGGGSSGGSGSGNRCPWFGSMHDDSQSFAGSKSRKFIQSNTISSDTFHGQTTMLQNGFIIAIIAPTTAPANIGIDGQGIQDHLQAGNATKGGIRLIVKMFSQGNVGGGRVLLHGLH